MGKIFDALQRAEHQRSRTDEKPAIQVDFESQTDPRRIPESLTSAAAEPTTVSAKDKKTKDRRPRKVRRLEKRRQAELEKRDREHDASRPRVLVGSTVSDVTEEYRTLRARIQSVRRVTPFTSLVITSARPNEGKTTTAINLALSFGMDRELKTCLVDCDLRTPGVSRVFGPAPKVGIAEVLETDAKLDEALIELPDSRLSVLPVRALPTYPSELLGSKRMVELFDELKSHFELIVVDSPPVLGLPDAVTLVDLCDAALLVVGAGTVNRVEIEASLERLDTTKLIGTVFNRCHKTEAPYGGGYGYGND